MRTAIILMAVGAFLLLSSLNLHAAGVWKSEIPEVAVQSRSWEKLLGSLRGKQLSFGAMAASVRMLTLFQDLPTKESAYRAVIELIDQGYPFAQGTAGDVKSLFVAGDLNAEGNAEFVNSYNLFKYIINHEKGMDRWARQYYEKMNGDGFAKYQFYLAVQEYSRGSLDEATVRLKNLLKQDPGQGLGVLAIRAARTLARIHYEQKHYAKSLDIYRAFLLKMNPIQPSDWLEAAWNHYHLKQYPEALGMLYNLESKATGDTILLEKYTLRALIHRESCATENSQAMIASFERDFGSALAGIREGSSPKKFPILSRVQTLAGSPHRQLLMTMARLEKEAALAARVIPESERALAAYLYASENQLLKAEVARASQVELDRAAEALVTLSEHLKFLKHDVARRKFDPDQVFTSAAAPSRTEVSRPFQVLWPQQGVFWRNERINYRGKVTSRCE